MIFSEKENIYVVVYLDKILIYTDKANPIDTICWFFN